MSSNTTNQTNNIYPKSCSYGCNNQIYWNLEKNENWEVFTQKKDLADRLSSNNDSYLLGL
jgi:hypothetical protein